MRVRYQIILPSFAVKTIKKQCWVQF